MLSITNHQGNANQNYCEILPHTHQDRQNQSQKIASVGEDVEKLKKVCIASGNVKECSQCGKGSGCSFKKLSIEFLQDPAIPLLGIYPKELKAGTQTDIYALMFIAAFAKKQKKNKCSLMDEWITRCGVCTHTHTMEYY